MSAHAPAAPCQAPELCAPGAVLWGRADGRTGQSHLTARGGWIAICLGLGSHPRALKTWCL